MMKEARGAGIAGRLLILSAVVLAGGANGAYGCERYSAPFFRGSGGFVVEPRDGRSVDVTVSSANRSDTRTVSAGRNGLAVELLASPLCTGPNGVFPAQCHVAFSGIMSGGWYWLNGERNVAVASLVCSEDLGGGPAPLDPGGVQTLPSKYGTGTLFVHDTQDLIGIVPQLSPTGRGATPGCERYVAPFFRGKGGFVARPEGGRTAEVTIERDGSVERMRPQPRSDGLAVQLLSDSLCTDSSGQPVECKVSFTGIGGGGWYWVNGDRNAAVAPLVCEGRLAGAAAAVPGGVKTSRAAFGTGSLFVHDTQRLMGIVPHLPGSPEDLGRVEVRVSVFGGGTVEVVGGGELNCPEAGLCNGYFPAAGSVTLRPLAPFGFTFDRWRGCDSVSGADCVLALHADRRVSADFLSTQPLTLKDNVVVFDRYRLDDVQQYDPDSGLMILAAYARVGDIGVGSILVSSVIDPDRPFESYFLRRVTDLSGLLGSATYLKTRNASLEDLIAAGSLALGFPLGAESVSSYELPAGLVPTSHQASDLEVRELPDGRRAFEVSRLDAPASTAAPFLSAPASDPRRTTSPIELGIDIKDAATGLKVKGTIGLAVDPSFLVNFGYPPEFKGQVRVESDAKLKVSVDVLDKTFEYPLDRYGLRITFAPIPAGPLVIVPSLSAVLVLKVNANVGFEPVVTLEVDATAGAHYVEGDGWSGIWEFERDAGVNLPGFPFDNIEAEAGVEAGVAVELKAKVYGLGGPVINVGPYLGVSAFVLGTPRGSCRWDYDAYLEAKADFGGELNLFFRTLRHTETLSFGRKTLPLGRDCFGAGLNPPRPPESLRFPSTTADSITVEWDRPGGTGGDYATTYEVLRSHDQGRGRIEQKSFFTAEARFHDVGLFPSTEYCYEVRSVVAGLAESSLTRRYCTRTRGVDVTPPDAPLEVTAEAKSSGVVELRWSEANDDVGVSHYAIVELTGGAGGQETAWIGSTAARSFAVTRLRPNTEYCFGVSAVDDAGNESVVSTACASTLATRQAEWRFRIACIGRDYLLEGHVDLDEDYVTFVSVVGEGQDYDGDELAYALTGPYDNASRVLDGTIDWSFEGVAGLRKDRFKADLSLNDTGDIAMSKSGSGAGCDAVIRFDRRGAAATSGSSGSAGSGPGVSAEERTGGSSATFIRKRRNAEGESQWE